MDTQNSARRTVASIVSFGAPFLLDGVDGTQPPGSYPVQSEEELIEGISFIAYRRVSTVIFVPLSAGSKSTQAIPTSPQELDACQDRGSRLASSEAGL